MTALPRAKLGLRDLIKPAHLEATQQRLQGLMSGFEPPQVLPAAESPPAGPAGPFPKRLSGIDYHLAWLREQFPTCVFVLPLKVGVREELIALRPDIGKRIGRALHRIVMTNRYCRLLIAATRRHDLAGNPCEEVLDLHREHAKARLADLAKSQQPKEKS